MEKTMKKVLSLVLALIFIMSCMSSLSSCDFFEKDDPTQDTPPVIDNGNNDNIEEEPDQIKIIENGVPQYTIVYPDGCSIDISEKVTYLKNAIKKTTGVEMPVIKASDATDTTAKYMLIGATEIGRAHV